MTLPHKRSLPQVPQYGYALATADESGITVETYIKRVALDGEAADVELEAIALEGLNSGESVVADESYSAEKRRRLIERHENTGSR